MKAKKILALLIALLMAASILPVTAYTQAGSDIAHTHNYQYSEPGGNFPTCTTSGSHYMYCSCGIGIQVSDPPLGHAFGAWTGGQATCTAGTTQTRTCSRCGYTESKTLAALDHSWGPQVIGQESTCTESGYYHVTCRRCGMQGTFRIDALGHDWGEWTVSQEPTTEAEGTEQRDCKRGDLSETRPIAKLPSETDTDTPANDDAAAAIKGVEAAGCNAHFNLSASYEDKVYNPGDKIYFTLNFTTTSDEVIENVELLERQSGTIATVSSTSGIAGESFGDYHYKTNFPTFGGPIKTEFIVRGTCREHGLQVMDSVGITLVPGKHEEPECNAHLNLSVSYADKPYHSGDKIDFTLYFTSTTDEVIENVRLLELQSAPIATVPSTSGIAGESFGGYPYRTNIPTYSGAIKPIFVVIGTCREHGVQIKSSAGRIFQPAKDDEQTEEIAVSPVMYVSNTPADPKGFQLNETIIFALETTNNTPLDFTGYDIQNANFSGYSHTLAVGETTTGYLTHVVDENDIIAGSVKCQSNVQATFAEKPFNLAAASNTATAIVYSKPKTEGTVSLSKSVISAPANASYYKEGEIVTFLLTVTNGSNEPITAKVYDFDVEDCANPELFDIEAGSSACTTVSHTVTKADCIAHEYTNTAIMDYETGSGDGYFDILSNPVTVPCGETPVLSVTKALGSVPENGSYFTEGEIVTSNITVANTGDTPLENVNAYDILDDTCLEGPYDLQPGESFSCTFDHEVTERDVLDGCIINYAYADSDTGVYADSNASIADTDGKPDVITTDGFSALEGEDYCRIRMTGHGAARSEYEMTTCGIHGATEAAAQKLLAETTNTTEAWQQIAELWTSDINDLYDQMNAAAMDPGSRSVLHAEKTTFFMQINALKAVLQMTADEEAAAKTFALLLREKAVGLCYEAHEAPAARLDSVSAAAVLDADPSVCGCVWSDAGSPILYTITRCKAHASAIASVMPDAEELANTWMMARRTANTALNRVISKYYGPADETGRAAIALSRTTYATWLEAREKLLTLLYPNDPATVNEVLAMDMMNHAAMLCPEE